MNKIKGILISTLLLLSILTIIAPVSAGTVHVYPGDDIGAKLIGAASGDTVYVHAGSYTINSPTNINNKSLTIIGDGASSTAINFVGASTRMYFYMYPGPGRTINISGITFKGDLTSTPNNLLEFYNNDSTTNTMMDAKVTDCVFDKASQDLVKVGAYQTNMQSVAIENCEFKNGSRYGLSIYDYGVANLKNCLFYNNNTTAIFSTGHSQTTVQSCTVDKNTNGIDFVVQAQGSVKDSIITNNSIGIINEGAGTVTATYNNVWNNSNTNYQGVAAGAGSISQNPSYATGRLGSYYLYPSSPCVDKGSASAASIGLDKMTTRTDEHWDKGTVDMGYHYPSNRGPQTSLPIDFILKLLKKNKNK
ncbi:MAG TPA: right-handed parallel beta-helix repeat-containing protein [Methanofastidiosum sp.]|nr:right-handed parallel beta-helix repeat-containing protein [Methanofastidiosum sp.]HQF89711.1 right-handed parallel beta-helix repeat-containing protein [Methanofastidiosum sp.]HQG61587.1 right-handed parallel beta-helix repeat-containing protein [Methanofastidiosum sp.]HQK85550.1 right-handed parallel beta-helix repeat-containing protein [Methanofastidiosum sp.]